MTRLRPAFATRCILVCAVFITGCSSGRTAVPPGTIPHEQYVSAEDESYGHNVLAELTREYPLSRDDAEIQRVRDLVMRLAKAANADQNPWNVFVLQGDNVVNAAATRGNYVFVWTGMLNAARNDGELATVISHEIGHLLANHTKATPQEEASEIMARTSGQIAGQIVASQPGYAPLAQLAGVLVTEFIKAVAVNPETQRLETEADAIGFFLMADAGYDPRDALSLWSKMTDNPQTSGGGALQFLSSHPASADRLEALQTLLPEALMRYERARNPHPKRPARASQNPARPRDTSAVPQPPPPRDSREQPSPEEDSFAIN